MATYQTVSRTDLQSPASSPRSTPDPDVTERLRSRALAEFTFTTPDTENFDGIDGAREEDEEDEAELVLFGGPSAASKSHKIRLQSPDAATGDGGFVVKRPRSYYFADEESRNKYSEFRQSAIDGDTVMELARMPWPGCAMPWKVKTISSTGIKKCVLVGHPKIPITVEETRRKRSRKGKKARIAIRKLIRAKESKKAEEERIQREKEEMEREKRTRKNREKKLKRKARDKAKKVTESDATAVTEEPKQTKDASP
ncbi:uncharacterized protein EI97DRAFT_132050 [Westerdykella ornata]|uniref:Uncharacterized protein n=1 Tax=Westerdykella ornata TaxID=318751 RepID=A0A6A6JCA5_WESOR|nr:uncharacterized protein EI97DRAFT_132050 [Westerdykella ornata]KAF2274250.1 hypothetical protein EI97DRAFT_132050 [Westerdykella ornata]